jgi:uncharacterized protein
MNDELIKANKALVQRWVDAVNAPWDFDAMEAIFAEDLVYGLPWCPPEMGIPQRLEGRDDAIEFIRSAADLVEPENIHNVRIHAFDDDPNELLAEYSVDTRMKESGREYKNDLLIRVTIRDGKIAGFAEHLDVVRLLKSMGGSVNVPTEAV